MKGIILAGGLNSRLYPASLGAPKGVLPLYDKPMIYYPLANLIQAGIKDVLIICRQKDLANFKGLLGDGSNLGMNISYEIERVPQGTAPALIIGEDFVGKDNICLIYCDNIFIGSNMSKMLKKSAKLTEGCELYGIEVSHPERFGVAHLKNNKVIKIEEKPQNPTSNLAVTGLYFFDNNAVDIAKGLKKSVRGEYEITDVIDRYVKEKKCKLNIFSKNTVWLDTGTHESLLQASNYVAYVQNLTGNYVGCVEEEAYRAGFISKEDLLTASEKYLKTAYGKHLQDLFNKA